MADEQHTPGLLRLPRELRNMIYEYTMPTPPVVLIRAETIAATPTSEAILRFHPHLTPLAYVYRELSDEYPQQYFQNRAFYFTESIMRPRVMDAFLARYGEAAKAIKSAKVYTMLTLTQAVQPQYHFFKIRCQMTESDGAVIVRGLSSTDQLVGGVNNGLCCCSLLQLAAQGTVETGSLFGILRAFVHHAAAHDGYPIAGAESCTSCGKHKGSFAYGG
ncbi:hypothetical protein B0A55_02942 [Friedmanniomyces simplex]|uniref:Uncharacterized protein n=1 Tax=Friedmanniomyces simplex TaxID=329884 RepID=A0A4U0XUS3_9PEZI|nr:hypothetical protein B0A55_02942 [Friedmanniomyces simplex]